MKDNAAAVRQPDAQIGQFLTYRISRVQAKLNAQASRLLKAGSGLTHTQWRLLALIAATGRTNAAQLSRLALMDKSLISRNIKTLGEDGLIQIIADLEDNRLQHLELTAEGKALFEETLPRMQARQRTLRARLDDGEVAQFLNTLDKLERAADDPVFFD